MPPRPPSPSHSSFVIRHSSFLLPLLLAACAPAPSTQNAPAKTQNSELRTQNSELIPLADACASSSINTVIFRHSPLVTFGNTQFAAFYDETGHVVLAKRALDGPDPAHWDIRRTDFTGNTRDAHNTISLGIDGAGILHMAWDHHGANLNYAHTLAPGSLDLTPKLPMNADRETQVTYPEFYSLPTNPAPTPALTPAPFPPSPAPSDLLFLYRVGSSGNGDLVLKRYRTAAQKWETVAPNLVAGEGRQNAYPEFAVGPDGTLHLAWTWRRTPDVSTNHDICYAKSTDAGLTWTTSSGKKLTLPITAATSEIALHIPEGSELINQTTLAGDAAGHPYIATYFRAPPPTPAGSAIPQYHVVYHDGMQWHALQVGQRKTPFSLAGAGTKRIPISRPLILVDRAPAPSTQNSEPKTQDSGLRTQNSELRTQNFAIPSIFVIFRDDERNGRVTLAVHSGSNKLPTSTSELQPSIPELATSTSQIPYLGEKQAAGGGSEWTLIDLTTESWGSWEPSYDPIRWSRDHILDLFVQKTDQLDGNDAAARPNVPPTKAYVLECKP